MEKFYLECGDLVFRSYHDGRRFYAKLFSSRRLARIGGIHHYFGGLDVPSNDRWSPQTLRDLIALLRAAGAEDAGEGAKRLYPPEEWGLVDAAILGLVEAALLGRPGSPSPGVAQAIREIQRFKGEFDGEGYDRG